jgi:hypothetical protein
LYAGDEITVSQPEAWIKLNLAGYQEEVTQKNSPYLVTADKGKVPSVLSNLVAWLGRLMPFHEAETKDTPVASVHTRGVNTGNTNGLALYLLSSNSGRLLAGQRVLHLGWFGGKPPYTVTVTRGKTSVVLLTLPTEQPWLQTMAMNWTTGEYKVTIEDANGLSVSHPFTVVTDAIPYPKELYTVKLTPEVQMTLQATWLAAQENGKWSFEAYQQVAGVAEKYYPARLLRNALEVGLEVKGK